MGATEPDCIPEEVLAAARNDSPSQPEIIGPYQPSDFERHGGDAEFAWHWTAVRGGDHLEVKGLVHNKSRNPVQGVTFAVVTPGVRLRADSPGLIRPNRMRPFSFVVPFTGEEGQAQLAIAKVDRRLVAPIVTGFPPGAKPCAQAAATRPQSPAKPFSDELKDHFFTLQWNTVKKGDEIEVKGFLENRDGPTLRDVILAIRAHGPGKEILKTQTVMFHGVFEKRETRDFTVSLRPGKEPERITVSVERYQFDVKGF